MISKLSVVKTAIIAFFLISIAPGTYANPVATITASSDVITEADIGSTISIIVTFNEPMDTSPSSVPLVTFNPGIDRSYGILTFSTGEWESDSVYNATYIINAFNEAIPGVSVTISGALSASGDPQIDTITASNLIVIKAANPSSSITAAITPVKVINQTPPPKKTTNPTVSSNVTQTSIKNNNLSGNKKLSNNKNESMILPNTTARRRAPGFELIPAFVGFFAMLIIRKRRH